MVHWTIGRKITTGFAAVLVLLAVVVVIGVMGVGRIVRDADDVIAGNQLKAELQQREIDHLNWALKVMNATQQGAAACARWGRGTCAGASRQVAGWNHVPERAVRGFFARPR